MSLGEKEAVQDTKRGDKGSYQGNNKDFAQVRDIQSPKAKKDDWGFHRDDCPLG